MSEYQPIDELKDAEKAQVERVDLTDAGAEDTAVTPEEKGARGNLVGGVVLIAVGVIFLFANLTDFHLDNWWALFIMIPAVVNFSKAWESYRASGRFTKQARGSLTGGLILTLVASAFLFSLDWGLIWPLFLVIGGVAVLLGGWFD